MAQMIQAERHADTRARHDWDKPDLALDRIDRLIRGELRLPSQYWRTHPVGGVNTRNLRPVTMLQPATFDVEDLRGTFVAFVDAPDDSDTGW